MKVLLLMCVAASAWAQGFSGVQDWNSVRIRLEHTPCLGTCSVFTVEITGDGTVQYDGQSRVAVLGRHSGRVSRDDVESLFNRFRGVESLVLRDEAGAAIENVPGRKLTWTADGVERSVLYADGDQVKQFADLVRAVEERARVDQWVFGTKDTVEALRREGLDLRSEDAGRVVARVAYWGSVDAVRDLIAAGAPLDVRDTEFCPVALECAFSVTQTDSTEILRLLIAAGASRRDQATKDRALALAKGAKATEAIRMLREYGARD